MLLFIKKNLYRGVFYISKITIIGAGMMGSAMCFPASDNEHIINLVGTPLDDEIIDEAKKTNFHKTLKRELPLNVTPYKYSELTENMLEESEIVICGVSSFGIDWFADEVVKRLPPNIPVLSITKGLHCTQSGKMISFIQYIKEKCNNNNLNLNAVGGPCISFELADRHNTLVAFCGEDLKTLNFIKNILETSYYHINITTDIIGVETAVAMKNAYALGVSLAIGLAEQKNGEGCKEEYNPQAGLFAQSVREMRKIIKLNGGNIENIDYGAGDLYVTVFGGRTRMIGTLLGRGLTYDEASEILKGVTLESVAITKVTISAIKMLSEKGIVNIADFPLLTHIDELINNKTTVNIPWKKFI